MTDNIYTMGVDIGSTASKCVVLKNGSEIAGTGIIPAGTGTSGPDRAIAAALDEAGIAMESVTAVTATGYGRNSYDDATYTATELICHTRGAYEKFPEVKTIIDIGGQDAKVISVGPKGKMTSFLMNDKCAAGTGRFLDVMSRVLDIPIEEMGAVDAKSEKPITISSTCTVFAESEVISQLSVKTPIPDIVAGIHKSVANRTGSLVSRMGIVSPVVMSGGVAQNAGVVRALEKELNTEIKVLEDSQTTGAYGAALYAWDKYNKTREK